MPRTIPDKAGKPGYRGRLRRLQKGLGQGIDALLVTDLKNIRYLSGFTGSSAYIIVTGGSSFFLTDPRYATQAKEETAGFRIRIFKKAVETIAGITKELKLKAVGFESGNLSFDAHAKIKKALSGVRLKPARGLVQKLRLRKDAFEIARIRESAALLDKGFDHAMRLIKPGVIESEAAFSIEAGFRKKGAEGLAFDTILASGFRGALPHGKASGKAVKKGELVVVDMGVLMNGYNSDETRTFMVGRPGARHKEIYGIVKEAQAAALDAVKPGVKAAVIDGAARSVIDKAGYGKYFGHGTGHGVGLDIHEGPGLGPLSEDALEEGMVITVEPGIYIPGWGGVRIEDMALVTKTGMDLITHTDKELISL